MGYDQHMRTTPAPSMRLTRAQALAHNVAVLTLLPMGRAVAVNTVPVPDVTRDEDDE